MRVKGAAIMVDLAVDPRGVIIPVRAHAAARRNAILGARQGMLRVAVTAAPEKGKANRAIIEILSKSLGVSKSAVELVSGDTSAQKRFLIVDAKLDDVRHVLERAVS
jgi:uncharacterized protein (TIGR00251 family)